MNESAMAKTFHCSVITPERAVLECDATSVVFPAHDGEMGVLSHRAPLVCKLGIGELRVETGGDKLSFYIDGGFAQVGGNELSILTEQAKKPEALDAEAARAALVVATALPNVTDEEHDAKDKAVRRAKVQLELAKS